MSSIKTGAKQIARLCGFILFLIMIMIMTTKKINDDDEDKNYEDHDDVNLVACEVTEARWSSRWTRQFWLRILL